MDSITFRQAHANDVQAIVQLLADDALGALREDIGSPLNPRYAEAFGAINTDANQLLAVASDNERIVGCLQISFIPGLSHTGQWRGQIESVRVAASHRGQGLGQRFLQWAIDQCLDRGCGQVQLTTDKSRRDAARFYERLGFTASHEGMKLKL